MMLPGIEPPAYHTLNVVFDILKFNVSCFQGWLVDLVNKFGGLDGFQILLDRFTKSSALSVPVIAALIK